MRTAKLRYLGLLCVLCASVAQFGCALPANPKTEISYGPGGFRLYNSKDVGIKVDEATYNAQTREAKIKNLEFSDNASAVRLANVEQMKAYSEQMRIVLEGFMGLANTVTTLGMQGLAVKSQQIDLEKMKTEIAADVVKAVRDAQHPGAPSQPEPGGANAPPAAVDENGIPAGMTLKLR